MIEFKRKEKKRGNGMKNKKGISLIVLIITIIVVIILAAIVILTLSKNNPIESAKEAKFKEDIKNIQDEVGMYIFSNYPVKDRKFKVTNINWDSEQLVENVKNAQKYKDKLIVKNGELVYYGDNDTEIKWAKELGIKVIFPVPKDWEKYIASMTDDKVPVPKGFSYLTGTKETGVVIEDGLHNEFVWIPVDGKKIKYEKLTNINGTVPTIDLITLNIDENADVIKYGGFYIGRYEATTPDGTETTKKNNEGIPTCQKQKTVWTNIDLSNARANAIKMYSDTNLSVQSGLITGKAWDTVCSWIEDYITTIDDSSTLYDSRFYGNYSNSAFPADIEEYGEKQVSGFSDKWMTKNIYDLAGNVEEWSNEMCNTGYLIRGGDCNKQGDEFSISYRRNVNSGTYITIGFRVRLYIKTV